MTHNADDPDTRDRSAAGPGAETARGNDHGRSNRKGVAVTEKQASDAQNVRTGQGGSDASRQDRSDQDGRNDMTNQQPGRKKRRWRSRRKKGQGPQSAVAQQGVEPKDSGQKTDHESAQAANPNTSTDSVNGKTASSEKNQSGDRSQSNRRGRDQRRSSRPEHGDHASSKATHKHDGERKRRGQSGKPSGRRDQATDQTERRDQDQARGRQQSDGRGSGQGQRGQWRGNRDQARQGSGQGRPNHRRPARAHSGRPAYAALDLGTNNCRLLVAEPHGQSFRVVDAFSRIVRLGEGLSQSGRLSDDAQERAIAALKVCQSKLNHRQVKRFRLIATEACRRAANGGAFLHRVYKETGLKLEIVNRETEARLAVSGCASLVHPEAEGVVLFDIGGGSSEIVWLDLDPMSDEGVPQPGEKRNRQTRRAMRHLSERIRCWTSLQVGVVTLSEKHGGKIVDSEQFEAMVAEVREMLHEFDEREALAKAIESKHIHMLGTSGTVTTLAGVHLGLERYDRRQVDGTWLTAKELRGMIGRVLEMDFEERMRNPCIGQDRADLVLAGCAILEAFHREWPVSQLRVADRGLREGILTEMMIDDGVWNPQAGKKKPGKNRRPRRRGGRGHRGQQANRASRPQDGSQNS